MNEMVSHIEVDDYLSKNVAIAKDPALAPGYWVLPIALAGTLFWAFLIWAMLA